MTLNTFIEKSHLPASLIRATVRQSGGWESFKESAQDVTNHGADGGFGGWIYYTETLKFTRTNKKAIMEALESMAQDLGEGVLEMVQGFGVFRNDKPTTDEIARAIYQGKGEIADTVLNVLAWFALEEVSRSYCDLTEN